MRVQIKCNCIIFATWFWWPCLIVEWEGDRLRSPEFQRVHVCAPIAILISKTQSIFLFEFRSRIDLFKMFNNSFSRILVFVLLAIHSILAFTPPHILKRFEYKLSFKGPHLVFKDGTIPFWEHSGSKWSSKTRVTVLLWIPPRLFIRKQVRLRPMTRFESRRQLRARKVAFGPITSRTTQIGKSKCFLEWMDAGESAPMVWLFGSRKKKAKRARCSVTMIIGRVSVCFWTRLTTTCKCVVILAFYITQTNQSIFWSVSDFKQNNPYVLIMVNDGTKSFDHQR